CVCPLSVISGVYTLSLHDALPISVVIDAKSGTTGAGIKPGNTTHFSTVNDNFRAYGISSHRHTIEIEEQFRDLSTQEVRVQFTRSEEHTSELQSRENLVCRLLLEK